MTKFHAFALLVGILIVLLGVPLLWLSITKQVIAILGISENIIIQLIYFVNSYVIIFLATYITAVISKTSTVRNALIIACTAFIYHALRPYSSDIMINIRDTFYMLLFFPISYLAAKMYLLKR